MIKSTNLNGNYPNMANKDYEGIHTCTDAETVFIHVKGLYHVAMVEHGLKPHGIAAIEQRVEELKNE